MANQAYFQGKVLKTTGGDVEVSADMATAIEFYLIQNGYVDQDRHILNKYHDAKKEGQLVDLPEKLALHADAVFQLIDSVFSDSKLPLPEDDRKAKTNPLNANFEKVEFKALWKALFAKRMDELTHG